MALTASFWRDLTGSKPTIAVDLLISAGPSDSFDGYSSGDPSAFPPDPVCSREISVTPASLQSACRYRKLDDYE